jgi:hypothetical protein
VLRPVSEKPDEKEMLADESRHFQNALISEQRFCANMTELILSYASSDTRRPAEVSERLNKENYRTVAREKWTPRLARLLLSKIFSALKTQKTGRPKVKTNRHSLTRRQGTR